MERPPVMAAVGENLTPWPRLALMEFSQARRQEGSWGDVSITYEMENVGEAASFAKARFTARTLDGREHSVSVACRIAPHQTLVRTARIGTGGSQAVSIHTFHTDPLER